MSDTPAPTPAGAVSASSADVANRSKLKSLLIVGLCAALAGGGYLLGGRTASAGETETVPTTIEGEDGTAVDIEFDPAWCEELTTEPALGEVIDLPAMNINLADGHYLRIAVSLGMSEHAEPGEDSFVVAPAQDIVVSTLSGRSLTELASPEGREEAKQELTDLIIEHYGQDVISVFLTEFVMQ